MEQIQLGELIESFLAFKASHRNGFLDPELTNKWIESKKTVSANEFYLFWGQSINGLIAECLKDPLTPTAKLSEKLNEKTSASFILSSNFEKVINHEEFCNFMDSFVANIVSKQFKNDIEMNILFPIIMLGKDAGDLAHDIIGRMKNKDHKEIDILLTAYEKEEFKFNINKAIYNFCDKQNKRELTQAEHRQIMLNVEKTLKKHSPDFFKIISLVLSNNETNDLSFANWITSAYSAAAVSRASHKIKPLDRYDDIHEAAMFSIKKATISKDKIIENIGKIRQTNKDDAVVKVKKLN